MKVSRDVVIGLLNKLNAPYTGKIATDRAVKKLERYINKEGVPKNLSQREACLLVELGLMKAPKPQGQKSKKTRVDWITIATRAILKSGDMEKAGATAAKDYLKAGGRETPNNRQNGTLYTSYASKVLVEVGMIELGADGKIIRK